MSEEESLREAPKENQTRSIVEIRKRPPVWVRHKIPFIIGGVILGVALIAILAIIIFTPRKRADIDIVGDYLANKGKEYSDEQKVEIVKAYKNLLEVQGEDYVDTVISREDQNEITFMGMSVNEYVFRDYKHYAYLNSDNSFIDVAGFSTIAGFDVNATNGADGYANLNEVEITIDDKTWAVVNLTDEISSFFERFDKINETEPTNTIYGVDKINVDENTRLYITYLDVQFDDSRNITALRVSGHLLMK